MPLLPSASKEAFSHNVAEMIRAGRPRNQALAASYANQRKNRNVGGPNVPMQGQPRPPMPQFSQPMPQGTPMAQPPQFRNGYDMGGIPTMSEMAPWYTRAEDRGLDQFHGGGLFGGSAPGRADTLPRDVPVNSHVIPADVVSAIGQGNTLAGGNTLTGMFHSLPWGIQGGGSRGTSALHPPAPPRPMQPESRGGRKTDHGRSTVPIAASSGEFLVHPSGVYMTGLKAAKGMKLDPKKLNPEKVMNIGHDVIDKFIIETRKREVKAASKRAPPRKD